MPPDYLALEADDTPPAFAAPAQSEAHSDRVAGGDGSHVSLMPRAEKHDGLPEPAEIVARVKRVFSALDRELVGFGPVLMQCVYALLTRENLLIFSPAGTAKTLFASLVFSRIRGARVFDTQMSKGTLAEELFGSVDTEQLKRGRLHHNTRDTLVDANLAFVDEFFDANDMVLRALLGIFHERVFKRGCQIETAALHTGIAAANYLRATDVTEAVLDRFLFRASIRPDYSPVTLLAVDRTFAQNYGRRSDSPGDLQIPLEHLGYLSQIVRGLVPHRLIHAPPHVLFLKNVLFNRYRELVDAAADKSKRRIYLSPRTYAKCRVVLNAAALFRGRTEVTVQDLSQLKYAVTTIGGPEEQAQAFDKALAQTVAISGKDLEHVDNLSAACELADQVLQRVRNGETLPSTSFLQRLLRFFGLRSTGDITFDHVRRFVDAVEPRDEQVKRLKQGVIGHLQSLTRQVDHQDCELFHCE
jgi:MoxR-like ATPase